MITGNRWWKRSRTRGRNSRAPGEITERGIRLGPRLVSTSGNQTPRIALNPKTVIPNGVRGVRNLSLVSALLSLLDDADLFECLQVFNDQFEGHGAILGGHRIADLLCIPFAVGKIQGFVGVVPNEKPRVCGYGPLGSLILKVVTPEPLQRTLDRRIPREFQEPFTEGCSLRARCDSQ